MDDLEPNDDTSCDECGGDAAHDGMPCDECDSTGVRQPRCERDSGLSYTRNAHVSVGGEEQ